MDSQDKLATYSINIPFLLKGLDESDHRNYWRYGWPAVMITDTAFFRNLQYHKSGDTYDRLNYLKMAQLVNNLTNFLIQD